MNLQTILPPITTPFRDDRIDGAALKTNIARWLQAGLGGIVVLGSNGEAPFVDDREADEIIATARGAVPSDRAFLAGTARESTPGTIAATRRAAELGADAVLVRTPSYFKSQMTMAALVRHYEAVADTSPVPVILYNFTAVTGINLQPAAVARLSEHPNIVGVKESGGDVAQVAEYVSQTPAAFSVLVGSAPIFYASLCVGAVGGILALACIAPELTIRLYQLARDNRHAEALAIQRQVAPLARLVTITHGVPGLKAALDLCGYQGGPPRPPLVPVSREVREEISRHLAQLSRWAVESGAVVAP